MRTTAPSGRQRLCPFAKKRNAMWSGTVRDTAGLSMYRMVLHSSFYNTLPQTIRSKSFESLIERFRSDQNLSIKDSKSVRPKAPSLHHRIYRVGVGTFPGRL